MKTTAKKFTTYGNLALVQLEVSPESSFFFRPGEPEIAAGRLIISEASGSGIVGKLLAQNNTDSFLLLTDADVLIGAKQNRVLNKSVLLSPFSKTFLDVSCIERRRWQYTSKDFTSTPTLADHDLRNDKAQSVAFKMRRPESDEHNTQQTVWSHIRKKMDFEQFESVTESYSDLIKFKIDTQKPGYPACEPEKGCNGLAVILDHKIVCIEIYGTEETYRHYFPKLRDSAFRQAGEGKNTRPVDVHEAYYKVLDALDTYEKEPKSQDTGYEAAGSMFIRDAREFVGFDLGIEENMVHSVLFFK